MKKILVLCLALVLAGCGQSVDLVDNTSEFYDDGLPPLALYESAEYNFTLELPDSMASRAEFVEDVEEPGDFGVIQNIIFNVDGEDIYTVSVHDRSLVNWDIVNNPDGPIPAFVSASDDSEFLFSSYVDLIDLRSDLAKEAAEDLNLGKGVYLEENITFE